jgi:hypothetical protein
MMASSEYDLGYLRAGLDSLESYLLADDIYWNLHAPSPLGEPAYPQLTLGGLLLARARLAARRLSIERAGHFSQLDSRLEATRTRWRVAWTNKAEREFGARLRLWGDFISEYRQNPDANVDRYRYEVSRRVMLHFLQAEAIQITEPESEMLAGLDVLLFAVLVPGEFIWEQDLQNGFPQNKFPYLYGSLRI